MNLIVTCARNLETETKNEIIEILQNFGDHNPKVTITSLSGILTVLTSITPFEVIKKIKNLVTDEPWAVRYCLRIIPIQSVTNTDVKEITDEVSKLVKVIPTSDSFRITIEKRDSDISSTELISEIAKNISNKVSLEQPDWIILIEIMGDKTGIGIINNSSIFSLERLKRSLSD